MSEHNGRLRAVLEQARKNNIRFGKEKLQLAVPKVKFIGHWISQNGLEADPNKIEAILSLRDPESKKELQRILGMVTYLSRFLPNLANQTEYLRQLIRKDTEFVWDEQAKQQFSALKSSVASAPVLRHFDPLKPIVITADASHYGLGAALLQDGCPVAYASAALSQTQQRYATIEKELLAIVFATEHFHYFIYGTEIKVETDHKPLLGLQNKLLDTVSPRLQKLLLRLQRYNVKLEHVPGPLMHIADTLSRDPCISQHVDTSDLEEVGLTVNLLLAVTPSRMEKLQTATKNDASLQSVRRYIQEGWPTHKTSVIDLAKPFWQYRLELHEKDGLLFRGQRLIIPASQQSDVLNQLHSSHLGVVFCKNRARESIYWLGMSTDIENTVLSCPTCQQTSRANITEPVQPHPIPARPWEKIGVDLFSSAGKMYLTVVDYHSKFAEVRQLGTSSTASVVIQALKSIFSTHGIPEVLVSDNGPPFNSQAFAEFGKIWDFSHVTSSPLYPKSNGMVERCIQTVKGLIKKAHSTGLDPYLALLNYRATPIIDSKSPASLLMGRQIRTQLPSGSEILKPRFKTQETMEILQKRQKQQADYANQHTKALSPLEVNQEVLLSIGHRQWIPAKVKRVLSEPRSYEVVTSTGSCYRRNRSALKIRVIPKEKTPMAVINTDYSYLDNKDVPEKVNGNASFEEKTHSENVNGNASLENNTQVMPGEPPDLRSNTVDHLPDRVTRSGRRVIIPARYRD